MTKPLPPWLQCLQNPLYARLYLAQTINLVGDGLTWVGLALLAFELAGAQAGTVLAIALTLRVLAFVVLSPIAGVIADRVDRKRLMIATHGARMLIVCVLPFVTQVGQIYAIVLALNVFYAFFAPTHSATVPLVTTAAERPRAIALSAATAQLLGVLGPGLAGSVAALIGVRQVFWLDGLTFLIAAGLLASLPGKLRVNQSSQSGPNSVNRTFSNLRSGSVCLWRDRPMRYMLALQFVAAIAGAEILINTIGQVQGILQLGKLEYGWVMAAFGAGATLSAIGLGNLRQPRQQPTYMTVGAMLITLAVLPANFVQFGALLPLWLIAGMGQSLVNIPAQTLIADRVAVELQGRVYGAHFAWSHLWWVFAYPIAEWLGHQWVNTNFFYSGLIGLALLTTVILVLQPQLRADISDGMWHEHTHRHDDHRHDDHRHDDHYHQHGHADAPSPQTAHEHLHFHPINHLWDD
jgi:MFS transporter, NRE family, putaive nickel resistance protein